MYAKYETERKVPTAVGVHKYADVTLVKNI